MSCLRRFYKTRPASWMVPILFVISVGGGSFAATISIFKNGAEDAGLDLVEPDYANSTLLTIPASCHVLKATVNISTATPDGGPSRYPEDIKLSLEETLLWRFNGSGYGSFGRQNIYSNGSSVFRASFDGEGGSASCAIRMPKNALVRDAAFEIAGEGPQETLRKYVFTGDQDATALGQSLSRAGDINNDGHEDLIFGAHSHDAGAAWIFLGAEMLNTTPDIELAGEVFGDYFGRSVSGAGDVNGDGYDDVMVGAPLNDYGGIDAGRAYIYFGGPKMGNEPNITLTGLAAGDNFGSDVADAGDVNGDGYADVLVSSPNNDTGGYNSGSVSVFFGGPQMDDAPDLVLTGASQRDNFGSSISGAGDLNRDGYDDVIIGAEKNDSGGTDSGSAYLFYGGARMDNSSDLNFTGEAKDDWFGAAVSDAKDVNNDGFPDLIIGAPHNSTGGNRAGKAYVYFGGRSVDNVPDRYFVGRSPDQLLGYMLASAGDFDRDGFDDVLVGAWADATNGYRSGTAYIYLGGADADSIPDFIFCDSKANDEFGSAGSSAGDFDNDGWEDVLVGARGNASNKGSVHIYGHVAGIKNTTVSIGHSIVWRNQWYLNETEQCNSSAPVLNEYLRSSQPTGNDSFGNLYVDVPLNVLAGGKGTITFGKLNITYDTRAAVRQFSDRLNKYIQDHAEEKDQDGNISIPLKVESRTSGRARLEDLCILIDEPPRLSKKIPTLKLVEDSAVTDLLDLHEYFRDDFDSQDQLAYDILSATNETIIRTEIVGDRYLSVDGLSGTENDNWTGIVSIVIIARDRWDSTTESNGFDVVVQNVNDAPVVTSTPPGKATGGVEYIYEVQAEDGDDDRLTYGLTRWPEDMSIDSSRGLVRWVPKSGGRYPVTIAVSDGAATIEQDFTITVPNRPPRIITTDLPEALTGIKYEQRILATDEDGDILTFVLVEPMEGMAIDGSTGLFSWTPSGLGEFPFSIRISDSIDAVVINYSIMVVQGNRAPRITSSAVTEAIVGEGYCYILTATDYESDTLGYSILAGPLGMVIDNASGRVDWIPDLGGNFSVLLMVSDGKGGEARQQFMIRVSYAVRPTVSLISPLEGQVWKGQVSVTGTVMRGTREVQKVQIRLDLASWEDVVGNTSWRHDFDSTRLRNGWHTLEVRAFDGTEYSDTSTLRFRVDNPAPGAASQLSIPALAALSALLGVLVAALAVIVRGRAKKE